MAQDNKKESPPSRPAKSPVAPLVAFLFVTVAISLANASLYPLFDSVFPLARDINVGTGLLASLAIVGVALHCPRLLHPRALGCGCIACALAGSGLMAAGLGLNSPALLCIGAVVRSAGTAWVSLLASAACCSLSQKTLLVGIPASYLAASVLSWSIMRLGTAAALALLALCPLLSYLFARRDANALIEDVRQAPAPSDARLTQPASYLPLTNRMFVCILLATVAMGFNLRVGPVEGGNAGSAVNIAVFTALAILGRLVNSTHGRLYDTTFHAGITLVIAAFLVLPLKSYLPLAQDLLGAASACLNVVFSIVLVAAASRNRLSAPIVLAWGSLMPTLGSIAGANLGAFVATGSAGDTAFLASGAVACALAAYVLIGLEGFSFADTIAGIEPVQPLQVPEVSDAKRFDDACTRLSQAFGLTPREAEVFALLARGRNNAFVQEELTLTRNTVKTYIKRIYAKLNVHSQQELIDLVEKE